jgi:hypothetical protein
MSGRPPPDEKIELYDDDDTPDPNTLRYPGPVLKRTNETNQPSDTDLSGTTSALQAAADIDCAKKAASVLSAVGMRELKAWLELQLLTKGSR